MKTGINKLSLCLIAILCCICQSAMADDQLQKELDKLAASSNARRVNGIVVDFDLSKYSEPLTETLYIRNGINVRFINGFLKGDKSLPSESPLIEISDNSRLELSSTAKLLAGKSSYFNCAIARITNGELYVSGGLIDGNPDSAETSNRASRRTKSDSYTIPGGIPIVVNWGAYPSVETIAQSESSLIMESGILKGDVNNKGNKLISLSNCTVEGNITSTTADVKIDGNSLVGTISLGSSNRVVLTSKLENELAIKGVYDVGRVAVSGEGYKLSNSDVFEIWLMDDYKPQLQSSTNTIIATEWGKARVVEYREAGHLAYMSFENQEITESLFLAGPINGSDISMIRELGNKSLKKLDLSHGFIVSGGSNYYEEQEPTPPGFIGGVFTFHRFYTEEDTISYHMFAGLETLESIALPVGTRIVEEEAFMDCKNLREISYCEMIEDIAGSAFNGCTSLTKMSMDYNPHLMLENGVIYDRQKTKVYAALPAVVSGNYSFPSSIIKINPNAFKGCTGLTRLNAQTSNITAIERNTFADCSNLRELLLPHDLQTVEKDGFNNCALTSLTLPKTVSKLGINAFGGNQLSELHCEGVAPATIQPFLPHHEGPYIQIGWPTPGTFEDTDTLTCKVYVPKGSIPTYKESEGWKSFKYYVGDVSNKICDSNDIQSLLDWLANGETDISLCDEPTIDEDVEVDDIQAYIDGTGRNPQIVVDFFGGSINIHQNAGMSFKNVIFASKDVATATSQRAAGNGGGIKNSGTLKFATCTFLQGDYTLENSGITYIGEGVTGCLLINKAGGRISITSPLASDLTVVIPTEADVEADAPIITGVSSADHILMSLPSGYAYKYDATAGGIVVYSTTGITAVGQQTTVKYSYDTTGRKVDNNRKGLHIQRMSDGTVRKVMINN